jgi:hypothetical protein
MVSAPSWSSTSSNPRARYMVAAPSPPVHAEADPLHAGGCGIRRHRVGPAPADPLPAQARLHPEIPWARPSRYVALQLGCGKDRLGRGGLSGSPSDRKGQDSGQAVVRRARPAASAGRTLARDFTLPS